MKDPQPRWAVRVPLTAKEWAQLEKRKRETGVPLGRQIADAVRKQILEQAA